VDLLDLIILLLRLVLVLILYLFLVWVVRFAGQHLTQTESPRPVKAAAPAPIQLLVLEPGESGLAPGELLSVQSGAMLGRTEGASIVVADPTVSGEHARLRQVGSDWVVTDLGSTNGTLLNQGLVQGEAAVRTGDVLKLGRVEFKVV
jgi:hypothetical protein